MKIKKILSSITSQVGFTMIELLVVISIIGILAVAVLSSINPIEQINKGKDTKLRSNAAQVINAVDRFYSIQEVYPWNDASYLSSASTDTSPTLAFPTDLTTVCPATTGTHAGFCQLGGVGYAEVAGYEWLDALSTTDEVKQSFIDTLQNTAISNALYMYKAVSTSTTIPDDLIVCYSPASKQFQQDALDSCENRQTSLPTTACPQGTSYPTTTWVNELICLP